jgi:hypothetical protein
MKFEDQEGNSVEFDDPVYEQIAPDIAQGTATKAGGAMASQVSGERLVLSCKARATVAEFRLLLNLVKNGSRRYYYTPEENYTLYSADVIQPFPAVMTELQSSWDDRRVHYITFKIIASDFV